MFEQNYQQPFGYGMNNNMMGGMPQQQPNAGYRIPSVLTPEQIKMLRNEGSKFSLGLTQEELLRAICNHRSEDGLSDSLVWDPVTGTAKCTICGYEFRPIEANVDYDSLKEDIRRVEDILQTTKLMYVDLPPEAAKEYYPIIGLLEKLPQLVEFAAKNMAKHDNYNYMYDQRNMGTAQIFANLSNMFSNMSMQQNYQQPNYYNQPAGFPQGAYPQPQPNAFGYNGMAPQPAPGYVPGTPNNFAYAPQQAAPAPAAPVAPATPAAPADATVTQTVNV